MKPIYPPCLFDLFGNLIDFIVNVPQLEMQRQIEPAAHQKLAIIDLIEHPHRYVRGIVIFVDPYIRFVDAIHTTFVIELIPDRLTNYRQIVLIAKRARHQVHSRNIDTKEPPGKGLQAVSAFAIPFQAILYDRRLNIQDATHTTSRHAEILHLSGRKPSVLTIGVDRARGRNRHNGVLPELVEFGGLAT